jgi:DNA mismatch repair ATPase MutL
VRGFNITVKDDGNGFNFDNFKFTGGNSSKISSFGDVQKCQFYGFRGIKTLYQGKVIFP